MQPGRSSGEEAGLPSTTNVQPIPTPLSGRKLTALLETTPGSPSRRSRIRRWKLATSRGDAYFFSGGQTCAVRTLVVLSPRSIRSRAERLRTINPAAIESITARATCEIISALRVRRPLAPPPEPQPLD